MSEKEYIVTLTADADPSSFQAEMTNSTGDSNIPSRTVDVANSRLGSKRNTHYSLSDAEASNLKNDSRVLDVAIPPQQDTNLEIGFNASENVNYYKGTSDNGQYYDWGKHRHSITQETQAWYPTLAGKYDTY